MGMRGRKRSNNWRAFSCRTAGWGKMAARDGSSQRAANSSTPQPEATTQPFQAPAEAPTMQSGWKRRLRDFQTPTSQAANMPPAERTSAVLTLPMVVRQRGGHQEFKRFCGSIFNELRSGAGPLEKARMLT